VPGPLELDAFIQKAYEVDPLICPKYQNEMKITSILEENAITRAKYCSIQGFSFILTQMGYFSIVLPWKSKLLIAFNIEK
jgi:hypothetical protein